MFFMPCHGSSTHVRQNFVHSSIALASSGMNVYNSSRIMTMAIGSMSLSIAYAALHHIRSKQIFSHAHAPNQCSQASCAAGRAQPLAVTTDIYSYWMFLQQNGQAIIIHAEPLCDSTKHNGFRTDATSVLQVARAVDSMLGDSEQEADQLVVALDAQQATTLQVTRKINLIKQLASLLNQV